MNLGHTAIVGLEETQQYIGQIVAGVAVEPSHDAEIDRDQHAVLTHEQVARVHVGVKETVLEHLAEKGRRGSANDALQVMLRCHERVDVIHRDAGDPLGRQDASTGALPVDPGHSVSRVVLKILPQFLRRRGFHPQIHFHTDGLGESRGRKPARSPAATP